jgi:hypothetical protein
MNDENTLTVKELRGLLFLIENEDITVKELRQQLFDIDNQDHKLTADWGVFSKLGIGTNARAGE